MQVEETAIPAVKIVTPKKHGDARGFFSEVYNRSDWDKASLQFTFVQDNHSFPLQWAPCAAYTFRRRHLPRTSWSAARAAAFLTSRWIFAARRRPMANMSQSNSPPKLAPVADPDRICARVHDFGAYVEVLYKTIPYSGAHDRGVAWDDPAIGIAWPSLAGGLVLSDKDRRLPRLKDAPELFE